MDGPRTSWRLLPIGWLVALVLIAPARGEERPETLEPDLDRLRAHVEILASPEFEGRRGEGARKAAFYLVEAFQELALEPLFDGDFVQEIPDRETDGVQGRNVGARLVGSDPRLRDQWIIVSAHFDHLGVRNGVLYPGADDNASGVAMMLEVARALAQAPQPPRRSVMFVGFDLEEIGLFGSRYFVRHPPVPLDQIALFLTADMIGRSLGGVCDSHVFVMGSEHAPGLRPWITQAAVGLDLSIALMGTDVVGTRSDYGPFRTRRIPYLFVSTGENPTYHTPHDTPDTLDYPKLEAISRMILGIVRQAAEAEDVPGWEAVPDHPFEEAVAVRDVLRILLDHQDVLDLGRAQVFLMTNTLRQLDAIVERGRITPAERSGMIRVAQLILVTVF